MSDHTTEVLFYHLERQPLDQVLPGLIEKTLERGWRAVIQAGGKDRVEAIDTMLWTHREDSFLPHGSARDSHISFHPVFITSDEGNPNAARVRFLVEGGDIKKFAGYARVVYLFDGRDAPALQRARAAWKRGKEQGCQVTYLQQAESGRWEKKA
jgi:DNA polymerase III subunit chi